ncbi:MAG TPA: DUF2804 domain-containing protein [Kofleriaceae bacterium]|nr:DUF2804 domain-containing protein [Kofleriaceae bacterium]
MERELTAAIEIADREGRLRRDAIGWSRRPLHRCNLEGIARSHAFDYWCVMTAEVALTVLVADVGLAGVALVSVLELASGVTTERVYVRPGGLPARMPASTDGEITIDVRRMRLVVGARRLAAEARTITGRRIEVDVAIERAADHETVNVLVPWDETRFHFTSKQQALPARGHVRVDARAYPFDPARDAFACRDFGRGRRPAGIDWCWAFASARRAGRTIGLNLGAQWTDGTGVTENAILVDGRVHKLAEAVAFELELSSARAPWHIRTAGSDRVALTFTPICERVVRVPPFVRLHQRVGHFDGTVRDDSGASIALDGVLGLAESVRGRW